MEKLIKLIREGYDRDKLVNKIVKPIKDKEKMFPKTKKEGTWARPDSPKAMAELKKLMSKPIKLGKEGDDAADKLYALIGDDELFDDLYDAGKKNPNGDARDIVRYHMERLGIKEVTGDKEEYQKFFNAAMKKFGIKSPAELKGDKEKEFYNYVDKNWKADHEESVKEARKVGKEPWIPFAKGDPFITKDLDAETGRKTFYNVRSDDFKIVKTFKTMKDAEKFLDRMNKESVNEARKEPFIPFAKNNAFISKERDDETGRKTLYNVRDGDSFKVIKTFKTMKDAEKFLDTQASEEVVKESIGHVGTNGQGLEADEQGRGLSPKAQFVKSMMNPEVAADANKTALQTFAAIMNSVSAKGAPRSGDNTEQDLPEAKQVSKEYVTEASITTSTDFDDYPTTEKDAKKFNLKVKKMPGEGDDINGPDLMTLTGSEKDIVSYFVQYMGANKKDTLKDLEQEFGEQKESVTEVLIGPFMFNQNTPDDELLNMYYDAQKAYNTGARLKYPRSDYKKAITQMQKMLKKRRLSTELPIGDDDAAMLSYRAALSKN